MVRDLAWDSSSGCFRFLKQCEPGSDSSCPLALIFSSLRFGQKQGELPKLQGLLFLEPLNSLERTLPKKANI